MQRSIDKIKVEKATAPVSETPYLPSIKIRAASRVPKPIMEIGIIVTRAQIAAMPAITRKVISNPRATPNR